MEMSKEVWSRQLDAKERKLAELDYSRKKREKEEMDKKRFDQVSRYLALYLALCTKQVDLFAKIFDVYKHAPPFIRKCMHIQV
jgi:hypothetical protein